MNHLLISRPLDHEIFSVKASFAYLQDALEVRDYYRSIYKERVTLMVVHIDDIKDNKYHITATSQTIEISL